MSLKSLFIVDEENKSEDKKTREKEVVSFPTSTPSTPTNPFNTGGAIPQMPSYTPSSSAQASTEAITKAVELYKNGFDALNQAGYDFYEFYQAVSNVGITNPQAYSMAYAMGIAMDKTITKDKLLQQADYYVNELTKIYNDNVSKGSSKKQDLVNQKTNETQALTNEVVSMQQQLEALQVQIQDRQSKLSAVDGKYAPLISDIDSKLSANDVAKNQLIQSIQQVKTGIQSNLN